MYLFYYLLIICFSAVFTLKEHTRDLFVATHQIHCCRVCSVVCGLHRKTIQARVGSDFRLRVIYQQSYWEPGVQEFCFSELWWADCDAEWRRARDFHDGSSGVLDQFTANIFCLDIQVLFHKSWDWVSFVLLHKSIDSFTPTKVSQLLRWWLKNSVYYILLILHWKGGEGRVL